MRRDALAAAGAGLRAAPLWAFAAIGCADLSFEPKRVPSKIELTPENALIQVGQPAKVELVVRDQDGEAMPSPPAWGLIEWSTLNEDAVVVASDGSITATKGADTRVTAKLAGLETSVRLRVNPERVRLSAPLIYLTQGAQNADGEVPLVAGRRALARIFLTGSETSFYRPGARLTLYRQGEKVFEESAPPFSETTPVEVAESRLDQSVNIVIPGEVIQPGLGMVVELDPEKRAPATDDSQLRIPASGIQPLNVIEMPLLRQVFVPTLLSRHPNDAVLNWVKDLSPESSKLALMWHTMPVGKMEVVVRDPFTSNANLTNGEGWRRWLDQITLLYQAEGRQGYYYGVAVLPPRSAWGGLGWIGLPSSVGANRGNVYAHELGHNLNLRHAPCGSAGGPDPNFPHAEGSVGVWGYDLGRRRLIDPSSYKDLMGYCSPDWISDYHVMKAMAHRLAGDGGVETDAEPRESPRDVLLVWGGVQDGALTLHPSFVLEETRPALPAASGPYVVEGIGSGGETLFSHAFTPQPREFGGAGFSFLLPYDETWDGRLSRIALSGPEGRVEMAEESHPSLAMTRDPDSGQIRAMFWEWSGELLPDEAQSRISLSRGIPERVIERR